MAINAKAGTLDWVIEGTTVLALKSENWTEFKNFPDNLDHKLILGARLPIMGLLVHIAMSTPITLDFLCAWIWP